MLARFLLPALFLSAGLTSNASTLRVTCDGPAEDAEVSVNGKFRGECPIDIQVNAGKFKVSATKTINGKQALFETETRIGDGVAKRLEITFGSAAGEAQPKAEFSDPKVVSRQRYEAELTEYEQSIRSCLPKHTIELSRVRREAQSDLNEYARECKAKAREFGKPDGWIWEHWYKSQCGDLTLEERRFGFDLTEGEKALKRFEDNPQRWCEAQFTKPREPQ